MCRLCSELVNCQKCGKQLSRSFYSVSRWHHKGQQGVVCKQCESDESWKCQQCRKALPQEAFSESMWKNRKANDRQTVCIQCESVAPTHTCNLCKVVQSREAFSESMWKHRHDQRILCKQCESVAPTHTCDLCTVVQSREAFSESMWKHRHDDDQRTLCNNCSRPRCTAKHCKTCQVCRSETCKKTTKRSHCSDAIIPLHHEQLPKTMQEVHEFLCAKCRYITCVRKDSTGIMCGKEMPRKAQARLPLAPKDKYICGVCQNLDDTRKSLGHSRRS